MSKRLLQFVHPALEKSRVNRRLLERARSLEAIEVNDLYEAYPDFGIDVDREQRLLTSHETIVFQFPFYWYSSPALLKEWFDLVLQYGWAYGKDGTALVDKRVQLAVTTGGSADSYSREGHNGYTMSELLRPIESTVRLCGMQWREPFIVHEALHLSDQALDAVVDAYARWLLED